VTTRPDCVVLRAAKCQLRGSGPLRGLDERFSMAFTTRITWAGAEAAAATAAVEAAAAAAPQPAFAAAGADGGDGGGDGAPSPASPAAGWQSFTTGLKSWRGGEGGGEAAAAQLGMMTGSASIEVFCEVGGIAAHLDGCLVVDRKQTEGLRPQAVEAPPTEPPLLITGSFHTRINSHASHAHRSRPQVIPPFHLMPRDALEATCSAALTGLVKSLLPVFMRQLAADYQRWAGDAAYRAARAARSKPMAG
jgi:hypothetical protein